MNQKENFCVECDRISNDMGDDQQFIDDPEGWEEEITLWHRYCHGGRYE